MIGEITMIYWDLSNMGTARTLGWIDLIVWTVGIAANLGIFGHMLFKRSL